MSVFGQKFDSNYGSITGQYFQIGRVKSIVMGPIISGTNKKDPDYQSSSDIGKIKYELLYSPLSTSKSSAVSEPAYPIFNFIRNFPLVNEIVLILAGPSESLNDGYNNQQFFYFPPYSIWNNPNHGAFPNMAEYADFLNKNSNRPDYVGTAVSSSTLPLGYTFTEDQKVRNLQPFEGDILLQARFGQSIRFGSTVPVMKKNNNWSNSGTNGDPITILINNQGTKSLTSKFDATVEDINRDGSSIYMTSTQEIFLEDINNFPLNSFGTSISTVDQPVIELTSIPITNEIIPADEQDKNSIG
jgi:hypothetical protein